MTWMQLAVGHKAVVSWITRMRINRVKHDSSVGLGGKSGRDLYHTRVR